MPQPPSKDPVKEKPNPFFVHKETRTTIDHLPHQIFTTVSAISTWKTVDLHQQVIDECSTTLNDAKQSLMTIQANNNELYYQLTQTQQRYVLTFDIV